VFFPEGVRHYVVQAGQGRDLALTKTVSGQARKATRRRIRRLPLKVFQGSGAKCRVFLTVRCVGRFLILEHTVSLINKVFEF